jgi:DNA-binding MarR family transcriptional regulator
VNNTVAPNPSQRQAGEESLDRARAVLLDINQVGLVLTAAIDGVAGNELSGNAEIAVLMRLLDGPVRPRELVESTGLSSPGVTNLLDRLDRHGLITRSHDDLDDRRAVVVSTSAHGEALIKEIRAMLNTTFDSLLPLRRRILRQLDVPTRRSPPASTDSNEAISRIAKLATDLDAAFAEAVCRDDPSPARTAVVLAAASVDGGTRHCELRELTTLSSGGVTQLIERLELQGLIERSSGRAPDRRAVTVRLTPSGEEMYGRCMEQITIHRASIAAALR